MAVIQVDFSPQTWRDVAGDAGGFRAFLQAFGLDDMIIRPTEWRAFANLKALAVCGIQAGDALPPLSPLEVEVLAMERVFMANYRDKTFVRRYGVLDLADKYRWIASKIPGLAPLQVRAMLDDIEYAIKGAVLEAATEMVLADMLARMPKVA